ncbi:MAG: MCE family protein [Actinomycetota bacterium]|jgi:phospholipid/cholesterol/gamma-HCH transport system substrate-binding protein|nr:MCE family protein [Actinomycetota bacterium]
MAARRTRARRHWPAAAAAGLALALSSCGINLQSLPLLGVSTAGTYPVRAVFSNALNLDVGAPVRLSDVTVGTVRAVAVHGGDALVTMAIHRHVRLPADTTATTQFVTPLGSEYVQLGSLAGAGTTSASLAPGATIGPRRTNAAPNVQDTLAAAGTLLFGGGLGQVETLTNELNQVLGGNQPQVRQLLAELDTAIGSLAANDGHIDQALSALAQLSGQLDQGRTAITQALATLPGAAATVAGDNTQLAGLLQGVNTLAPQVVTLAQRSGSLLTQDSQQLAPAVDQLVSVDGQLGSDLSVLQRFATLTTRAIPGDYLQGQLNILLVNQPLHLQLPAVSPLLQAGVVGLVTDALQGALGTLPTDRSTPPPAGANAGSTSRDLLPSPVVALLAAGLP